MSAREQPSGGLRFEAVLFDLLMAVMDSPAAWSEAAGDAERGLRWRDAVTQRMVSSGSYVPYEDLVTEEAARLGLPQDTAAALRTAWRQMRPRPDAPAIASLQVPYAFVTNCSMDLAREAARQSGLNPTFTLSAEEAGRFKPRPEVYRMASERLAIPPARTLFVAGAPYDAEGARAAGLVAALIARRPIQSPVHPDIRRMDSLEDVLRRGT
jgi:2-haloalkanoic acid dehalogenase type II